MDVGVYPTEGGRSVHIPFEYYMMLTRLAPVPVTKLDKMINAIAREHMSTRQMISTSFEELTYDLKEPEFVSIDEFHTSMPSPNYEITFSNIISMNLDTIICRLRSESNDKQTKRRKTNGKVKRSN